MGENTGRAQETVPSPDTQPSPIRWDDSALTHSYANVINVSSLRDEVVLLFGLNRSWERQQDGLNVHLLNRIILSPFTAKRLATLLNRVIQEYEARFGELTPEEAAPERPAPLRLDQKGNSLREIVR